MNSIQSQNHRIGTFEIDKISLSSLDDKWISSYLSELIIKKTVILITVQNSIFVKLILILSLARTVFFVKLTLIFSLVNFFIESL